LRGGSTGVYFSQMRGQAVNGRDEGFTLVELMVVVVVLGVAVALLAPAFARASRHEKIEACSANLKALHEAQRLYYGSAQASAPELGKAYWEKLAKAAPPLIQPNRLICPLADPESTSTTQYLGPAADPRLTTTDDPIGCDVETNHSPRGQEGGNVLLKSGAVVNDHSPYEGPWGIAHRRGKCRP
jgi:prepilin-type N-terminal cleavage/methylation domain-containing protein